MIMQIIVFSFLVALGLGVLIIIIQGIVASHLKKKMFEQEKKYFEKEKRLKNQNVADRKKK